MTNQYRILNRIVFINSGVAEYANIPVDGPTCFVGTNNLGKTVTLRGILFFYNADSQRLGITAEKKKFEDFYFEYPNSYIIYEVKTETGFFLVLVYKQNRIFFRFIDAHYQKDLFIEENQALGIDGIIKILGDRKIEFSNQIETFDNYRNILYGNGNKDMKKYHLLRANEGFKNIPKSLTDIFLSSSSEVQSQFVKKFIADTIAEEDSNIDLTQVKRQLKKFTEMYQDIDTFINEDNLKSAELIKDNFEELRKAKSEQYDLAIELGGAIKYAKKETESLKSQIQGKQREIDALNAKSLDHENGHQIIQKELIGSKAICDNDIVKANEAEQKYKNLNIVEKLKLYSRKPELLIELDSRTKEYALLTATFNDIDIQFQTRYDQLSNEKKAYETSVREKALQLDIDHSVKGTKTKEFFEGEKNRISGSYRELRDKLKEKKNSTVIELQRLLSDQKLINQTKYFDKEISEILERVSETTTESIRVGSSIKLNISAENSFRQEYETFEQLVQKDIDQFSVKIKEKLEALRENLKSVENKLRIHQDSFYGFLDENYPGWHDTIGKVCNEDVLFRKDLAPELLKGVAKSLYGINLDLSGMENMAKTISEYEVEREKIKSATQITEVDLKYFIDAKNEEIQTKNTSISKKISALNKETNTLQYQLEKHNKALIDLSFDLEDWKRKANSEKERNLSLNSSMQKETNTLLEKLKTKENLQNDEQKNALALAETNYQLKLKELNEVYTIAVQQLSTEQDEQVVEIEKRKKKIDAERSELQKERGINPKKVDGVKTNIDSIKSSLNSIADIEPLIITYNNDKDQLIDKLDEFTSKSAQIEKQIDELKVTFDAEKEILKKTFDGLNNQHTEFKETLKIYEDGFMYYEDVFKSNKTFTLLQSKIENADLKNSIHDIRTLCSKISSSANVYEVEFSKFQEGIIEYSGKFKPDNHLELKLPNRPSSTDYTSFAQYLEGFLAENRIEKSKSELAKHHWLTIDSIASKVKTLINKYSEVDKVVRNIHNDLAFAQFSETKLIEFIKLKTERSDDKVLKKLRKIQEFKDNNGLQYGEVNIFNLKNHTRTELDKKSVDLLFDLHKAMLNESTEQIGLQDTFELYFKIKEKRNESDWTTHLDGIGSTGTDVLVKTIIYITLLHIFIKKSIKESQEDFRIHCIIDEIGRISAPLLKQLIAFAEERRIFLINGTPNESKIETAYTYTYTFEEQASGYVRVIPLAVITVDV